MSVPILKQGDFLIASIQAALTDTDLRQLREDISTGVGRWRSKGVILDVTALDVMDSFATRTLGNIAQAAKLRGADTIIAGIQPDVAFAMVQLGLTLDGIETVLDLDEALATMNRRLAAKERRGR